MLEVLVPARNLEQTWLDPQDPYTAISPHSPPAVLPAKKETEAGAEEEGVVIWLV